VAVNMFDGALGHDLEDIRWALAVSEDVPLITFDARQKLSVRDALLAVLHNTFKKARAQAGAGTSLH
jgi:signal recognition particle receptor subunit beta